MTRARLHHAWLPAVALLVAACGGATPSSSLPSASNDPGAPSASASPTVDASLSPPPPSPTPEDTAAPTPSASAAADAAPIELRGTWAREGATQNLRLLINPTTYRITRDGNSGGGSISVDGDAIRFGDSSPCNGVGHYRWTLDDRVLTFEPIEPDECPGRAAALEDISYVLLFPPT